MRGKISKVSIFLFVLFQCIFLFAFFGMLYGANNEQVAGPKIVLPETTFNFGVVKEGKIISHSFKVLNKGNAVLKIIKVRPG